MQILLLNNNQVEREILEVNWEDQYEVEVITADNDIDLIRKGTLLNIKNFVIFDNGLNWDMALQKFFEGKNEYRLVVVGNEDRDLKCKIVKSNCSNWDELFCYFDIKKIGKSSSHIKIRSYQFLQLGQTICDLFIKIGDNKFIKIINKGDIFSKEILDHYKDKSINYFYIRRENFKEYLEELTKIILSQLDYSISNQDLKKEIHLAGIEGIHRNLNQIGIGPLTIELGFKTINSVLDSLQNISEIWEYLRPQLKSGNFLGEHSLATAILCAALADGMNWNSPYIKKKLIICALLHDIAIENQILSTILTKKDNLFLSLEQKSQLEYLDHPRRALDFVKLIKDVPSNIETIILEHHERPDGTGFPAGLTAQTITPLSCIFIIAEEFYHSLYTNGFTIESRNRALEYMSTHFNKGNFKAPLNSLINLFL